MARLKKYNLHGKNKWFKIMFVMLGLFILCGIIYSSSYALYRLEKKYNIIGSIIGSFSNNFILTYDNNGGYGCNTKSITYNQTFGELCTPERANATFLGWYEGDSDNLLTSSTVLAGRSNVTAKAKWQLTGIQAGQTYTFSYTGSHQFFNVPSNGTYKVELWGASGANSNNSKGAYTSGYVNMLTTEQYILYVGEGNNSTANATSFNGGTGDNGGWPGGGATDIRYYGTTDPTPYLAWNNTTLGLRTRIMVAAGSGAGGAESNISGAGGALYGLDGTGTEGATQTTTSSPEYGGYGLSSFGIGNGGCAGGGGYFGAGGSSCNTGAGGGSSYISGYLGSIAIAGWNDLAPKNNLYGTACTNSNALHDITCSYHYSGKAFTNGIMTAGNQAMPNYDNTASMIGNSGHGYAKITFIGITKTITLNMNGGSGCQTHNATQGVAVGEICRPLKAGYSFSHWVDGNGNVVNSNTIYTRDMGTTFSAVWTVNNCTINTTWEYATNGNYQTFTFPCDGLYKIEVWGAQGGSTFGVGGTGGYSAGYYNGFKSRQLFVYVGEQPSTLTGGFNGGGPGYESPDIAGYGYSAGGGASDVRTHAGSVMDTLYYRVIVAGGGGGGAYTYQSIPGGTGGGLQAGKVYLSHYLSNVPVEESANYGAGQEYSAIANYDSYVTTEYFRKATRGQGTWWSGGGGYFGGPFYMANNQIYAGAGGSGYIGGVINGTTTTGGQYGSGYARITLISNY